jgi:hypothetical protein
MTSRNMTPKERKAINELLHETMDNVVQTLEEDRYYPSVREAGDSPTEAAQENATKHVTNLITEIGKIYGVVDFDSINKPYTTEEVINLIDGENMDDFDGLTEVDSFVRDNGETKYRYENTVYKYEPTGDYILVENQCTPNGDTLISFVRATKTEKKEKVTYEWN